MITGRVTAFRKAIVDLTVAGPNQRRQVIEAVLDTGFNGFLTLPNHVVRALGLPFVGNRRATLGEGSIVALDLYLATVFWHEQEREILVLQADGGPLVGMALLYGNRVVLHVINEGEVCIEPWP
jgi:clan AA aspartic protease